MNKYNPLWEYIQKSDRQTITQTFDEIEEIAGVKIDRSFLNCKKELIRYGCQIEKISLKEKTITFDKLKGQS